MAPQLQAPSAILGRSESLPVSPTQKAAAVSGVTWRKKRSLRGPLRLRPRLVTDLDVMLTVDGAS